MTKSLTEKLWNERYSILSYLIIVFFSCIPLFFSFPFRDNSYLIWEGAYRMYSGQFPFADFGLPLGYGFWLLPTLSFHLFGPYMFSLIKIQVLINIVSGCTFKAIADLFVKKRPVVFLSVLLFCVTYIFINFWPWYNHIVIVYEMIGLYLLLRVMVNETDGFKRYLYLTFSALFIFLSVFTKQDAGGLAILIVGLLLIYHTYVTKQFRTIISYGLLMTVVTSIFIIPLLNYNFLYWFNYGQENHNARINLLDFASIIFGKSQFLKFYLLIVVFILVHKVRTKGYRWMKGIEGLFALLTLSVLFQAAILQVTSYIPPDVNIFFHSFFLLFAFHSIGDQINFLKIRNIVIFSMLILFWWSGYYWKYASRMFSKLMPEPDSKEVVAISSWTKATDTLRVNSAEWIYGDDREFERIRLPEDAIRGIDKLKSWREIESGEIKVLNMSELTPLASILDFELERGEEIPLWYHLNVAMFNRELSMFNTKIENGYYDLVIFEYLPNLNNFYPFEVREKLREKYELQTKFQAPRDYKFEVIEVYQPKNAKTKISQLD